MTKENYEQLKSAHEALGHAYEQICDRRWDDTFNAILQGLYANPNLVMPRKDETFGAYLEITVNLEKWAIEAADSCHRLRRERAEKEKEE